MPTVVLFWVWFCAFLNCAGWGLSALHQLNAGGYAVTLLIGSGAWWFWRVRTAQPCFPRILRTKFRRRFRRPFPAAFLILGALAFFGGLLHAPNNYDALAYRLPRVLHWLADGRWHWIHTTFPRVNARACGIEWVSAPFLALFKTDRLLFLINLVSFLLLPGLVFSVYRRLGVRRRVAWHWMWIVPTGYCFLLQAGSIGNDLFGAPFALAAVDFALRARKSNAPRDFFASVLAAALMTAAKTSDLPLLLPWIIAILPAMGILKRNLGSAVGVCLLALAASFVPTALMNAHFAGDWTGWKSESTGVRDEPLLRAASNAGLITVQNLTPPVFPPAGAWNRAVQNLIPSGLSARLHHAVVEPDAAEFHVEEMQMEENAGLGFGVTVLLLASIIAGGRCRSAGGPGWRTALRIAPWLALLALLSQSEVYPIGRILAPYYALLVPLLLAGQEQERLVRRCWWRTLAGAGFLMAGGLLVVSPARPLFPVGMLLEKIHAGATQHPVLARVETVYSVYRDRSDGFAPVRAVLPPGVKVLGLVTYDDPETSLWRPFGSRRIEHVCPGDTAEDLRRRGIEYVLVKDEVCEKSFGGSPDDWSQRMNARMVQAISLRLRASSGASSWHLFRLQ